MKKRSFFRLGAVLLSVSFAISGMNTNITRNVLAEEAPVDETGEMIDLVPETQESTESSVEEQETAETSPETAETFPEVAETVDIVEPADEIVDITSENTESQDTEKVSESQNTAETVEETEPVVTEQTEITLPGKSVVMPASEFLSIQEREKTFFLKPYDGFYLIHIKSDSEMTDTIFFNQAVKEEDAVLYRFDSAKKEVVDSEPVQDVMSFGENEMVVSFDLKASSDYVLVISHTENYAELGCTVTCTAGQAQGAEVQEASESGEITDIIVIDPEPESENVAETESEMLTESESETETESESEEVTESKSETESESEAETESENETESGSEAETESESETETESESESEAVTVTSIALKLDQDLETVPAAFLDCMKDLNVFSVTLAYSDGTEKLLDEADEGYALSVDYEDTKDTENVVHRTYHAVVKEYATGKEFEDTQYVDFGSKAPAEIKTEEMTSVILGGKKKWAVVQSTPSITGRYAMNSDKTIETMYYVSDNGEVICADGAFELQAGVTYQFLIRLDGNK